MDVGIHYKVTWHYKGTDEVARSNSSIYGLYPNSFGEKENVDLSILSTIEKIKNDYNPKKYNLRIEIKAIKVDQENRDCEDIPITKIGDQEVIDKDIEEWGY